MAELPNVPQVPTDRGTRNKERQFERVWATRNRAGVNAAYRLAVSVGSLLPFAQKSRAVSEAARNFSLPSPALGGCRPPSMSLRATATVCPSRPSSPAATNKWARATVDRSGKFSRYEGGKLGLRLAARETHGR